MLYIIETGGKGLGVSKKKAIPLQALLQKKKTISKKTPVDPDAPDIRALMDHISILHRKLDRYRDESRIIEKENKSLKEDLENQHRRHQMMPYSSDMGGRGYIPSVENLMPFDISTSGNYNLVDRLFD